MQINILAKKIDSNSLKNVSEFLNFGSKKLIKDDIANRENDLFKSKIHSLGRIFKKNLDNLKLNAKLDIVFLIDASSSVGETNFQNELKFVKKVLSDIPVDYNHIRVAVVTFSSENNIVSNLFLITSRSACYQVVNFYSAWTLFCTISVIH